MKVLAATFLLTLSNIFLYTKIEVEQIESQHDIQTLEANIQIDTGIQENGVLRHVETIQGVEVVPEVNYEKQKVYIASNFPQSPLVEYVDYIHELIPDNKQAALFLAVAGQESGFGTHNAKYFNSHSVMCYRPNRTLSCGWDNWEYSLKRTYELTQSYYESWDGTEQGINNVFMNSYCTEGCDYFTSGVWTFYQGLTSNQG